ncbi:hypothetical protein [Leptolyngbya sp. FACHB-16]|uniref:hypothetical protein n=1 Tax=unclassified Leptolyngbya TaxID=2650499 RepID=UPI001685A05C|nr:hypothetical protein [Leptolyngbya sp. FACHB-16]MBD2154519.1 hypothetical protein [Leptolyngbya sp. FACHB-16]
MAYSDFTLQKLKKDFGLQVDEQRDLFAAVEPVAGSNLLNDTLQETVQLAIAINTEKAQSEMIITPVLLEVRWQAKGQVSLFSGTEFNVDETKGLVGYCDYTLSCSKEQLTINAPVILITEAKNENIKAGLGQCIAGMVAAQQFNQWEGQAIDAIYGAVTTGEIWKFLKLIETVVRGVLYSITANWFYSFTGVDE